MRTYLVLLISNFILFGQSVTYSIDMIHSKIGFSIGYAGGVIEAEGRFKTFNGELQYNQADLSKLKATVEIDVKSIDTGMQFRDRDLVSPNWFDADKYPKISFVSKEMKRDGDHYILSGDLSMHGFTKEIEIQVIPTTTIPKLGPQRYYIGFNGELKLNRQEYKIHTSDPDRSFWKYNDVMQSTGEMFVADEVTISLKILGVRSGQEIAQDLFKQYSVDEAHAKYQEARANNPDNLLFMERDYNSLGYQYMESDLEKAIQVFRYNVDLYPKSANVYDSLAEALIKKNEKTEAKQLLQKGIEIAGSIPQYQRAKQMMQQKLANL
ncbi:MAG: YceI family protein [Calditrichaeota bacterium]|nr:YceI family protein [Calditrichota bacterium]